MAKLLVDTALAEGATTVAHGCTGKGNDQVRFDVGVHALAPQLKVIAPAREWGMTRDETIAYAAKYHIPVTITKKSPYSIDDCLWGKSAECGILEDPWVEPPDDVWTWTKNADEAPNKPAYIEIGFEKGIPVTLNGKAMDGVSLIQKMNQLAGLHGIGRIDHIENRLVGIKSRETYEAPAAVVLLQAHKALEAMTLAKDQLRFKEKTSIEIADIIYNGLWFSGLNRDLSAYIQSSQRFVTGTVRVKLFKGSSMVVGRESPKSLYNLSLATYDKGDKFDASAAVGFIHLWGLPVTTQAQIQLLGDKEDPMKLIGTKKAVKKTAAKKNGKK
jgi:argininosuccinate synthase